VKYTYAEYIVSNRIYKGYSTVFIAAAVAAAAINKKLGVQSLSCLTTHSSYPPFPYNRMAL